MDAPAAAIVGVILYGLAIGSFVNVLIARLPRRLDEPNSYGEDWEMAPWGEVLGGRSRCGSCGTPVRAYDNIPVLSYLVLRGRCRSCRARIGVIHPVVELLVPAVALLAVWQIGWEPLLAPTLWLIPFLVAIAAIDLRTMLVPTRLVFPALGGSVLISLVVCASLGHWRGLLGGVIGVLTLAGPLFLIWWFHPKGMGYGDVRLATLLGWNVGFAALVVLDRPIAAVYLTMILLAVAAVVGLTVGIALQVGFGRPIPFGPPLVVAALFCLMLAEPLLEPF